MRMSPFAVDVRAVSVLILAGLLVQVAARENVLDRQADRLEEACGEIDDVSILVVAVEVDVVDARGFLKKRVVVVPRPHFFDADAEFCGELFVEVGLEL